MKAVKYLFIICTVFIFINSCKKENDLSEEEIIQGLKEALTVGTDSSSTKLHKTDGYFGDTFVKILLPPDAHGVIDNKEAVELATGIDVDQVILSINRAAEDAAVEAKPIFVNAITSMTIKDARNILFGSDSAATSYLISKTRSNLFNIFFPKFKTSLDKDIISGTSAQEAWDHLVSLYNPLCVSYLNDWKPITSSLDTFATNKGLDGLFLKIKEEEKTIRKDPSARVNDILQRVFGELD